MDSSSRPSLHLVPTISPTVSAPTSTTNLLPTASTSSFSPPSQHKQPLSSNMSANQSSPPSSKGDRCRETTPEREVGMESDQVLRPKCEKSTSDVEKGEHRPNCDLSPVALVWPPWKRRDGLSGWMGDTVSANALVWSLIIQAFSTGILDATTYLDFSTFASNQTGNTILLTVAAVKMSGHLLLLTGVSLGSFLGAALVLGHLGHLFGVRRRAWLLGNVFFQLVCLTIATIFLSPNGPSATRLGGDHEWSIIMLFALMSGGQVAAARQASIAEIPTAPMTSSYVDLVSDKYLFVGFNHPHAGARNRRVGYIAAMITGSFIGGVMHKYAGSWVVVVVAMGFKLGVVGMMCLAPPEPRKEKQ